MPAAAVAVPDAAAAAAAAVVAATGGGGGGGGCCCCCWDEGTGRLEAIDVFLMFPFISFLLLFGGVARNSAESSLGRSEEGGVEVNFCGDWPSAHFAASCNALCRVYLHFGALFLM